MEIIRKVGLDKNTEFNKNIVFENIPDSAFMPVLKKRDIVRAMILTRNEKSAIAKGSADVKIVNDLGEARLIDRMQVLGYRYLNGKKIKLSLWRSGVEYIVFKEDNTPAVAMLVPSNCSLEVRGYRNKNKNKPVYIICAVDKEGVPDRNRAGVISRERFRRMYSILQHPIIDRYKNGGSNSNDISRDSKSNINLIKDNDISKNVLGGNLENIRNASKDTNKIEDRNNNSVEYKYNAIGRLLNHDDKVLGFIIESNKGEIAQVSTNEMLALCNNKLVGNIISVRRESDGVVYLRGNGIKISELKKYYV